jgi:hypothetical protein
MSAEIGGLVVQEQFAPGERPYIALFLAIRYDTQTRLL